MKTKQDIIEALRSQFPDMPEEKLLKVVKALQKAKEDLTQVSKKHGIKITYTAGGRKCTNK